MGSIERRIQHLEGLWQMDEGPEERDPRQDERRAEIRAKIECMIDSQGGEREMDPRRVRAIEDFLESVKRGREHGG
jgi:hypothetical protein